MLWALLVSWQIRRLLSWIAAWRRAENVDQMTSKTLGNGIDNLNQSRGHRLKPLCHFYKKVIWVFSNFCLSYIHKGQGQR